MTGDVEFPKTRDRSLVSISLIEGETDCSLWLQGAADHLRRERGVYMQIARLRAGGLGKAQAYKA